MLSPWKLVVAKEAMGNNFEFMNILELVCFDDIVNLRYSKKWRFKDNYKFLFWATRSFSWSFTWDEQEGKRNRIRVRNTRISTSYFSDWNICGFILKWRCYVSNCYLNMRFGSYAQTRNINTKIIITVMILEVLKLWN